MKIFNLMICAVMLSATPVLAQESSKSDAPKAGADYSSDIVTVRDAQDEALQQAKAALEQTENPTAHNALETAITEMQRAETALDAAKNSPAKLGPALTAEQTAYQALLKATPREFRITRQRNGQNSGGQSGQPERQQLNQLDLKDEANRYETERQASAQQTQQQREASEVANRLKELAQRQQDLNDRLRELQSALQTAKTDQEREDLQRQLKRLRDEERQMLADVDQLRQRMEQSPNADSNANARQQLDQTRQDVERAAQQMERNSPSDALAAGTRAEQSMQNVRDDMRRQSSSQFSDQMRQLRNQARELAQQEDDIAKKLDSMQNGQQKLDNSADTQQLADQLAKQANTLTNLMANMRAISEQSENVEPLLSQKLYDTFRRADQKKTDNLLQMGAQLAQRGFLPQTSDVERSARTNINELRQGVDAAAESVLGNEADALRFAQQELQDLTRQMQREVASEGTNGLQGGAARTNGLARPSRFAGADTGQSNQLASARGQRTGQNAVGRDGGTNSMDMAASGQNGNRRMQEAQNNSQAGQRGEGSQADSQGNSQQRNQGEQAQNGQQGQRGQGDNQQAEAQNREGNQGQQGGQGDQQAENNSATDQNSPGGHNGGSQQGDLAQQTQGGRNGGQVGDVEQLTQIARQRNGGSDAYGGGAGGPLTGARYLDWADRLRDVEQALDSPDLRYQLATVRERASALRQQYRQFHRRPDEQVVREQIIEPMTQVRVWVEQELARQQNANSLVPLDRDPVPDNYSELVRKYYEKLGSAQ